ncbi:MAG: hypothetical protein QG608_2081 [Actinomycetota bacterium]|nr:hypothetical protein [Actinomycetota bacterium]
MNPTGRGTRAILLTAALSLVTGTALTACGGSDGTSQEAGGSSDSAQGNSENKGADMTKITECLTAAGISIPTRSGRPSDAPSGARPSDAPSGGTDGGSGDEARPSGGTDGGSGDEARPSGGPGGGGGLSPELMKDEKVQAAIKACGLTLPTGGPEGRGAAGNVSPSTSATTN